MFLIHLRFGESSSHKGFRNAYSVTIEYVAYRFRGVARIARLHRAPLGGKILDRRTRNIFFAASYQQFSVDPATSTRVLLAYFPRLLVCTILLEFSIFNDLAFAERFRHGFPFP